MVLALCIRSTAPARLYERTNRPRGSGIFPAGIRAAGERFSNAYLFSRSLAEKTSSQATVDSGRVHAAGREHFKNRRPIADRDRSPGLFRTNRTCRERFEAADCRIQ